MNDKDFLLRYARQIAVEGIGKEGQKKISDSKVLIIGCGALGSMVAMQLAGAGIGTIGIVDFDTIDISNLQRQFFFTTKDQGKSKSEILQQSIRSLNPLINVIALNTFLTSKKSLELFQDYDFIIDATDNPESKKMTGDISYKMTKPCCIGGVRNFSGQVMTFLPEDDRFEDFFGTTSSDGVLPCSLSGVIGPAAAICASIQASECIKFITGAGELLSKKLFYFDLSSNIFQIFSL